jgi:hypothetical protein
MILLNAAPNGCNHLNDDELMASAQFMSDTVGDGGLSVTDIQEKSVNQVSTDLIDNVEFENILAKNKDQLMSDYQPTACQLVQVVHLVRHPGCQPKAIASFACSGSCTSYVRVSSTLHQADLRERNLYLYGRPFNHVNLKYFVNNR